MKFVLIPILGLTPLRINSPGVPDARLGNGLVKILSLHPML